MRGALDSGIAHARRPALAGLATPEPGRWAGVLLGVALWLWLATPAARAMLEARLVSHALVQLPLLVVAGWLLAGPVVGPLARPLAVVDRAGLTGLVLGLGITAFWMLPRTLDAALVDWRLEAFKLVSLPLGLGLLLRLDWQRLPPLLRGVVKAQLVSMCLFLAWLYTAAPVRLCNSYLAAEQAELGRTLLVLGLALALLWGAATLLGPAPGQPRPDRRSDLVRRAPLGP